jgi:hypothetical protein
MAVLRGCVVVPISCMTTRIALLLGLMAGSLPAQTGFVAVQPAVSGNAALNGITQGAKGFVAVGDSGAIVFSPDGSSWQTDFSGVTDNLASVAFGLGRYVAVGGRALKSRSRF